MTGSATSRPSMGLTVDDLVGALGGGLLTVVVPSPGAEIDDITVAEPAGDIVGQRGDLVLAIAAEDAGSVVRLIAAAADQSAAAIAVRRTLARDREVRQAARSGGVALLALSDRASWAHVVWLLRGVLDRSHASGSASMEGPLHDDLFALADGCAALLEAPVTIEDPQSRVLAYSSRQGTADAIRVSTIVGRRVPEEVLASLRSRGVFRRLARADEPFFVPASPDGSLRARLVIPIRAGRDRLGSIWAVVDQPPPEDRMRALAQTASVVALHLLRMRSESDLARRAVADRLQSLLSGGASGLSGGQAGSRSERSLAGVDGGDPTGWLPAGPWRVAVLSGGGGDGGGEPVPGTREMQAALWESALRRASWRRPLLTTIDDELLVLVTDTVKPPTGPPMPGSWPWLAETTEKLIEDHPDVRVAAGGRAVRVDGLPRSRVEAGEVARLLAAGRLPGPVAVVDQEWAAVTVARAVADLRARDLLGPVERLRVVAAETGGDQLATLAAWLDHPGDPRAAAARLHVHPNTLRYRMVRVTEVLGVDLGDPEVRLALRLQVRALGAV